MVPTQSFLLVGTSFVRIGEPSKYLLACIVDIEANDTSGPQFDWHPYDTDMNSCARCGGDLTHFLRISHLCACTKRINIDSCCRPVKPMLTRPLTCLRFRTGTIRDQISFRVRGAKRLSALNLAARWSIIVGYISCALEALDDTISLCRMSLPVRRLARPVSKDHPTTSFSQPVGYLVRFAPANINRHSFECRQIHDLITTTVIRACTICTFNRHSTYCMHSEAS
ncbi:uncharacterized protein BT62DRAFT_1012801 [Guyanagaster necrorhizus]|uniref:Uncharacterized protein n=1 Tax=Guyanagaster necrorhizus TaxID=856835 RepID=A0A9P7VGI8_9AGAR|nr:uncharacterized protein BT62DRAFT_1012801 [Guyanagaster necrorhizus MCA 3950]KAG7440304.1 hypothetical protein BT62DRAFT_1012801 [Guyanagaster necrorhizus MCA 3950]